MSPAEMRAVADAVDRAASVIGSTDAEGAAICLILEAVRDLLYGRAAAQEAQ